MMKVTNLKMVATLILVVLMGVNTNIFAQRTNGTGGGNGAGGGNGNGYAYGDCHNIPDLTDAQKTSIKELQIAQKKEMLQYRNQLGELQARMKTLRSAENENMTEINSTIDKITTIKNAQMKQSEAHKQEIRKLLTDDQKVIFDSRQGKRNKKGHRGGKRNGKRNGNGDGNGQGQRNR